MTEEQNKLAERRASARLIELAISGIGPGFYKEIAFKPHEWREIIDALRAESEPACPHMVKGECGICKSERLMREATLRRSQERERATEAVLELQGFADSFAADDEGLHLAPENWNRMRELIRALKGKGASQGVEGEMVMLIKHNAKLEAQLATTYHGPWKFHESTQKGSGYLFKQTGERSGEQRGCYECGYFTKQQAPFVESALNRAEAMLSAVEASKGKT